MFNSSSAVFSFRQNIHITESLKRERERKEDNDLAQASEHNCKKLGSEVKNVYTYLFKFFLNALNNVLIYLSMNFLVLILFLEIIVF